eukprot:4092365-Amphidinium_carterae.3
MFAIRATQLGTHWVEQQQNGSNKLSVLQTSNHGVALMSACKQVCVPSSGASDTLWNSKRPCDTYYTSCAPQQDSMASGSPTPYLQPMLMKRGQVKTWNVF